MTPQEISEATIANAVASLDEWMATIERVAPRCEALGADPRDAADMLAEMTIRGARLPEAEKVLYHFLDACEKSGQPIADGIAQSANAYWATTGKDDPARREICHALFAWMFYAGHRKDDT